MSLSLSDEDLRALLQQQPLASVVRGHPELLHRIRDSFPDLSAAADAVDLELLVPELSTIPAAAKFPKQSIVVANGQGEGEGATGLSAAETQTAPTAWSCSADGVWGAAYEPLAAIVERTKTSLLAQIQIGTPEALARADVAACGLVKVGRLYKRVEPRSGFRELTVPGHEALVAFAVKDLLPASARTCNGALADAACKLLVGSPFHQLCRYNISQHFDVREGRGLDLGWKPPPADACLYGIGWALLSCSPARPTGALAGLRVLVSLTSAERWLVAEVALGLLGSAVCGAADGSHTGPPEPSPLHQGLVHCLGEPGAGDLQGVLAAVVVIGLNNRCEHPGALLRTGLAGALIRGWRDSSRALTSALCAYALADLVEECHLAHYRPWESVRSEEEIETAKAPAGANDPEAWRACQRRLRQSALWMQEEHAAGAVMFRAELSEAGLDLPPPRRKARTPPWLQGSPADAPAPALAGEEEEAELEGGACARRPPSEDEALLAAWAALPEELARNRPEAARDAYDSYCALCTQLEKLFKQQLEDNEPGLYNEFV